MREPQLLLAVIQPMRPIRSWLLGTLTLAVFLTGCVPKRPPRGSTESSSRVVIRPDEVRVRAEDRLLPGQAGYDARELFAEAYRHFEAGELERAHALYDRLIGDFPESAEAQPSRYNAALAAERTGDEAKAVTWWEQWLLRPPSGEAGDALRARLRLAHCLQALGRFEESEAPLRDALARQDIEQEDRWEAALLLARADLAAARFETADGAVFQVRAAIQKSTRDEGIRHAWHSAMMWFVSGECFRLRARAVVLDRVENLNRVSERVDEKARLLLDARGAYRKAIMHRAGDWGGEAALALGRVFEDFRDDFLLAPLPADVLAEHAAVYRELLEAETLIFLQKAAADYEGLVREAVRWAIDSRAVTKLQAALDRCRTEITRLEAVRAALKPSAGAAAAP